MYTLYEIFNKLMAKVSVVLIFLAPIAFIVWLASLAFDKNELTAEELEQSQQEVVVDDSADTIDDATLHHGTISPHGRAQYHNVPHIRIPELNSDSIINRMPHVNPKSVAPPKVRKLPHLVPPKGILDHPERSPEMQKALRKFKEQQQQGPSHPQEATSGAASSGDNARAATDSI